MDINTEQNRQRAHKRYSRCRLISFPGQLPENQVRHQMATGCDWYPTILELCGLQTPAHKIDGKSLVPLITSAKASTAHPRFNWKSGKAIAIREKQWKLIVTGNQTELYDIPKDPGESINLAEEYPEVAAQLLEQSRLYWKSITVK